jgi:hypothetical protein
MLYKLSSGIDRIEPLPFLDFEQADALEKQLENLIANHLLEVLYEGAPLLPIFQERSWQEEADIYALDRNGDLVVFELKRAGAGRGALSQLLGYVEEASSWNYFVLNEKFAEYLSKRTGRVSELREVHQETFGLKEPLDEDQFNKRQKMYVVANSADEGLVRAVQYWRTQGLDIEFLPYRVYEIGGDKYFEFFSKPFDTHPNPAYRKGVLFDTNASYDIAGQAPWIERMITQRRVSAYGDVKGTVDYLQRGDTVFYYQKRYGVVAAARIIGTAPRDFEPDEERYWDVEFLTQTPSRFEPPYDALSVAEIREATGLNFYWAKTLKVPYLKDDQSDKLLRATILKLGAAH